ncbi:MAG: DMT family transporter [Anaerolineae bacterium]
MKTSTDAVLRTKPKFENEERGWMAWISIVMLVLSAAIVPVFIRMSQAEGIPSISIIGMRLVFATVLITPLAFHWHGDAIRAMTGRQWVLIFIAGSFHALGLFFLFFALESTTLMINGVLRRLSPVFTILIETVFLAAVFSRRMWLGMLATLVGMVLVVFGAVEAIDAGPQPILGAILSIGSAVTMAVYLSIGRGIRAELPFLAYTWVLFFSATVVSVIVMLVFKTPVLGFTPYGYFTVVLVALGAQIIGHMPVNYAVRFFPATVISLMMQIAVALSALLGFLIYNEVPNGLQIVGSLIMISAIIWVSMPESSNSVPTDQ